MAEISRFLGVIIYMYGFDHNPPHFHFAYGEYEAVMYINDGVVEGKMPSKIVKMVAEWLNLHKEELITAWEKARNGEKIPRISPLI